MAFLSLSKTTTAGARAALSSTSTGVTSITVRAKPANTGYVYLGGSTVSSSTVGGLEAGSSVSWGADQPLNMALDLAQIYIDVSVTGEGVDVWYVTA